MGPRRAALPALLSAIVVLVFAGFARRACRARNLRGARAGEQRLHHDSTCWRARSRTRPPPTSRGDVTLVTDSATAQEGAQWDAPAAVTFDVPSAAITYDLGETRSISALFLQADANDSYQILGSLDGTPASYRVIADVPNVVERGHGLRSRSIEIPATSARYLRFGNGNGDGFFSISELAAYCAKPVPFPPTMNIVQGPAAPRASERRRRGAASAPAQDGGRPCCCSPRSRWRSRGSSSVRYRARRGAARPKRRWRRPRARAVRGRCRCTICCASCSSPAAARR